MPRYFFTTSNGHCIPDEDGSELPDQATARVEAIKLVGELLQNFPDRFWETGVFRLDVADAKRATLFTVEVTAPEPPGTG